MKRNVKHRGIFLLVAFMVYVPSASAGFGFESVRDFCSRMVAWAARKPAGPEKSRSPLLMADAEKAALRSMNIFDETREASVEKIEAAVSAYVKKATDAELRSLFGDRGRKDFVSSLPKVSIEVGGGDKVHLTALTGIHTDRATMSMYPTNGGEISAIWVAGYYDGAGSPQAYGVPYGLKRGEIAPLPGKKDLFIEMTDTRGSGSTTSHHYQIFKLSEGSDLAKLRQEFEKTQAAELRARAAEMILDDTQLLRAVPGIRDSVHYNHAGKRQEPEITWNELWDGWQAIGFRRHGGKISSSSAGRERGYEVYAKRYDEKSFQIFLSSGKRDDTTIAKSASPEAWIRSKLGDAFDIGEVRVISHAGLVNGVVSSDDILTFVATPKSPAN